LINALQWLIRILENAITPPEVRANDFSLRLFQENGTSQIMYDNIIYYLVCQYHV
jgi:hypothetical protein